ncbi:MAG: hypothetical protein ACOCRU_02245 [bacterium]
MDRDLEPGDTFVHNDLKYIKILADIMINEECRDKILVFCIDYHQIHSISGDEQVKLQHFKISEV